MSDQDPSEVGEGQAGPSAPRPENCGLRCVVDHSEGEDRYFYAPAPHPAEAALKSLAFMLGWQNVPPQETLERDINALLARLRASEALAATTRNCEMLLSLERASFLEHNTATEETLATMTKERETAREKGYDDGLRWERAYLISCPWCGWKTNGEPISAQMTHLIACGDRRIGEERAARAEATKAEEALRAISERAALDHGTLSRIIISMAESGLAAIRASRPPEPEKPKRQQLHQNNCAAGAMAFFADDPKCDCGLADQIDALSVPSSPPPPSEEPRQSWADTHACRACRMVFWEDGRRFTCPECRKLWVPSPEPTREEPSK